MKNYFQAEFKSQEYIRGTKRMSQWNANQTFLCINKLHTNKSAKYKFKSFKKPILHLLQLYTQVLDISNG